jgi:hypothetical protein
VGTLAVDETYFDYDHWGSRGYYDSGHQLLGRVWPAETCGACTMRPLCPGLEAQYRRASGTSALVARTDDPEPILAFALSDRGVDPARAVERLRELQKAPRPTDFQHTDPRLVEFERADASRRLSLSVDEGDGPAFARSDRFRLTYVSWPGEDAGKSEGVQALLASAATAMQTADREGKDLDAVRLAVARATAGGWKFCERAPSQALKLMQIRWSERS